MVTVVLRQQLGGRHHRLDLLNHSLGVWVFGRLMRLGLCVCRMRMCEREMKKGVSCSFSPLVSPRDVFSAREVTAADATHCVAQARAGQALSTVCRRRRRSF